jgi:hypothetical protein
VSCDNVSWTFWAATALDHWNVSKYLRGVPISASKNAPKPYGALLVEKGHWIFAPTSPINKNTDEKSLQKHRCKLNFGCPIRRLYSDALSDWSSKMNTTSLFNLQIIVYHAFGAAVFVIYNRYDTKTDNLSILLMHMRLFFIGRLRSYIRYTTMVRNWIDHLQIRVRHSMTFQILSLSLNFHKPGDKKHVLLYEIGQKNDKIVDQLLN